MKNNFALQNGIAPKNDIASLFEQHRGGMKASEVAEILGFDRTTIYIWAAQNRIPSVKLGAKLVFDSAKLAAWWRSKEVPGL